ncbi:uncharacterized protein si:dkey-39a18.1 isoform X1 [Rhinichthys klamathensis goyatoka]|uniref:uncharacterized protein si:dkey-39a18.1 isoform X1 n=1 Tax=Rhinichthys klamathensis goyatoka TaxID=3034132 RepID=UPI0024B51E3F|nr:uncharacterized protein si:dkey-39a18.1 isoform X1 [Rhinichthys klamathensis goyatoka]XP_056113447.1 uncharacterized protein si:dkey-39a18.1 isoform X1 [Rhinichthys klamathensis goyatoka]XP_056113448.1 uncharacterized protein si:dkey-39a18.1 isoform X1 [Rhinichthys klamathensis goyatoka]
MGFSGKGLPMDGKGDWPSNKIRKHRSQSPFRDVSPVPSHFSEPVSFLQHGDVTANLPRLPGVRGPLRDEDDDDDVRSHKSLPAVMTTLTLHPRDKRSYRHSESRISLPPLISTRCSLIVKGTGFKTVSKLPPITKSRNNGKETDPPRPPCRSGCRPDKMEFLSAKPAHALMHPKIVPVGQTSLSVKVHTVQGNGPCLVPAKASGVSPRSRLTFQSPVVQAVYPISPDTMQQMRQTDRACQPLRSVLKKAPNRGVFDCPLAAHLLEPFSEFQEHLCRQILHSPLPYRAALPQVHISCHQDQVDLLPAHRGPYSSLMKCTVELCNSQGQKLPKITMTCPTPSPKRLCRTEMRHAA